MRKLNIVLGIFLLTALTAFAQDKCSKFYPLIKDAYFTHTMYSDEPSRGGIEHGKITYRVTEAGDNWGFYTVKLGSRPEMKQKITCTDDGVVIKSMQPGSTQGSETDGDNLYLPNDLSPLPKSLDDAIMKINNGAGVSMTRTMTSRMVVSDNESITTPAGTFTCYKLTYTTEMGVFVTTSEQWMAENVGVIKTIEKDSDGNLLGVTMLTSYNIP
ncbi:MAG: hypothetical protein QNJ57_10380 [Flavobacteriaceae bacterium]|nr:hypothetical protein [Flavobacteriaceae bacterium]